MIHTINFKAVYTYLMSDNLQQEEIDFAAICKEVRSSLGLTQSEMSMKLGVTLRGYQRYEAGERAPSASAAFRLAQLQLKLKIDELFKNQVTTSSLQQK